MTSIHVIEDDEHIRRLIATALADRGYHVTSASTAMDGLRHVVTEAPDVVVLDMGLPDLDGAELLKMIRAVSTVPVIAATARGEDRDIVATLDAGADDYVVKPYSAQQLEARIRAVLRRVNSSNGDDGEVTIAGLRLSAASRVATLEGAPVELAPKEFDLLLYLASHAGRVISKRELQAEVWREPYGGSEKTVDVHLSTLRKKLGETAANPRFIRAVHGVGVKLIDPDE